MTAVDVDALDKLREAATADGEWRVLDIDNRPGPHSREILDDEGSVAVCSGDNDGTGNTLGVDRAALIVAAVNALPDLIAEARKYRVLREAAEGLAEEWGRGPHVLAPHVARVDVSRRLRAVVAAVDGGGQ